MSARKSRGRDIQLVVGGESRVDLLPPEVARRARMRSTRRLLVGAVGLSLAAVAAGYVGTSFLAADSAIQLAEAQGRSSELIRQQGEYIEIRQVQSDLLGAQAAKVVGTSTEIDWRTYFDVLARELPEGVGLTGLLVEAASPLEPAVAATEGEQVNPLKGASVASLTLEVSSPAVIDVKSWLVALEDVPGFVAATPKTVTREEDGSYTAAVVLDVDQSVYWNRFSPEEKAAATAGETEQQIETED